MAFLTVGGCTRVSQTLLSGSPHSLRSFVEATYNASTAERAPAKTDSVNLTSAAMPRLGFAAAADVPVEEILPAGDRPLPMNGLCPADMASIDDRYCIDKYEAALLEVTSDGSERPWPYYEAVDKLPQGSHVRAVSEKGVFPQGYISGKQAAAACKASGKRLCKPTEWKNACKGPEKTQYPYGNSRQVGTCNDNGKAPIGALHFSAIKNGTAYSTPSIMNDPQLNQLAGTLAETGSHEGCTNGYGVYDMVGNIHEWVDDPSGAFQGGYYLDVEQNGEGCGYKTDAHRPWYHDYSTGFRCCADPGQ
jgi:sulfatase modifying factor 1